MAAIGDVKIRLDLQNQVALFDLLPLLHRQIDDLTTDFRADFDLQHRLNFPIRNNDLGQVSTRHLLGLNGNNHFSLLEDGPNGQPGNARADQPKNQNFPAFI